ncbi:hypothetical protein PVIIG_05584 [Plasmodium vivax India VII]|uniref:VIR protein n=1 Tax=Plasmodium vivax India VII TaxID=1077284 RepID=A0A0J9SLW0_PLAVI|nr:hypothetical protein PVIIG_05584 [Plasmodium vivax India VII]
MKNNYSINEKISGYGKTYLALKQLKPNELSEVFTNLMKYLSNGHVFTSGKYNGQGTCNYISYLLYDGIRNKIGGYDEDTFDIFKEFVDKYNETTSSTMCKDMIIHLDDDKLNKMKALYELYDNYYILSGENAQGRYHYCGDMLKFVHLYNSFLHKYPSDSLEFNNILTPFKVLMENVTKAGRKKCTDQHFTIREPDLFKQTEEQIKPQTNITLGPENKPSQEGTINSVVNPQHSEVTSSPTRSVGEQERTYTEISQRSDVSEPPKVVEDSVSQETLERRPPYQNMEHSEQHVLFTPHESYEPRRTYRPGSYYEQERYIEKDETFPPREYSFVGTEQLGLGSEKENVGFMANMRNTITGVLGEVDPIPVVGVSGGMGALFLLFRVFKVLKIYPCVYSIFKEKFTFHIINL